MPAKKKANGEGSITQRKDGRWMGRLSLDNGKRKTFYGKTRKDVDEQLTRARADQHQGLPIATERQTVAQFLDRWLHDTARHRLRPTTYRRYESLLRVHALPIVGKVSLAKLTPQQLSQLYGQRLAAGFSPRTVQFLHATLHSALKQAVLWGLLPRNPADAVRAPRPERYPMQPLDADQTRRLLEAAQSDPMEALYVLAVMVGMRQGELLGLQWADIDWDAGRLQVRHTLQWQKGDAWALADPKTGHSRRSIRLPATTLRALKAQRARQLEQRLAAGPLWHDSGLIFTNAVGRPVDPIGLDHRGFPRLLHRAGLPTIRFHDLRHTYATLALLNGEKPKVVQETLGHASITLTMDTYSHVLPDMQEDAASRMEQLLGRATGS